MIHYYENMITPTKVLLVEVHCQGYPDKVVNVKSEKARNEMCVINGYAFWKFNVYIIMPSSPSVRAVK